jgi:hypothetical protein
MNLLIFSGLTYGLCGAAFKLGHSGKVRESSSSSSSSGKLPNLGVNISTPRNVGEIIAQA